MSPIMSVWAFSSFSKNSSPVFRESLSKPSIVSMLKPMARFNFSAILKQVSTAFLVIAKARLAETPLMTRSIERVTSKSLNGFSATVATVLTAACRMIFGKSEFVLNFGK